MEHLFYEDRLRELGLFSLQKAAGRPCSSLSVPEGGRQERWGKYFQQGLMQQDKSNDFKLREERFRLDIRKKFFTMKAVKHWHRLSREAVEAPSLETFKARLDGALSKLV